MNRLAKILFATGVTITLLLIFYFFFPHVWGEIVYPLDYKDSVKNYSKQRGIDPNLTCALIYTESHFNKDSTSGVGARGLMQIMPATGASIAEELGEKNYSADSLYDPDTNIRYGTFYIKGLLDKYGGDVDLALAGYNAGVARADSWKDRGAALPYETIYFIQKVKGAQDMYNKVYGQWTAEPEVKKPNPFYQGVNNIGTFVKGILGI